MKPNACSTTSRPGAPPMSSTSISPSSLTRSAFNAIEREPAHLRSLVASNVVSIFKHFWADAWGARSEYLLLCSVAAILDYPDRQGDVSLLGVQRMMSDPDYRARIIKFSRNSAECTHKRRSGAREGPVCPPGQAGVVGPLRRGS